jgi:hypothetical protein
MTQTNNPADRNNYEERREQIKKAALKVFAGRGVAGYAESSSIQPYSF